MWSIRADFSSAVVVVAVVFLSDFVQGRLALTVKHLIIVLLKSLLLLDSSLEIIILLLQL